MLILTPSSCVGRLLPEKSELFHGRVVPVRFEPLMVIQAPSPTPGTELAPLTMALMTGLVLITVTVVEIFTPGSLGHGGPGIPFAFHEPTTSTDSDAPCGCRSTCTFRTTVAAGLGP